MVCQDRDVSTKADTLWRLLTRRNCAEVGSLGDAEVGVAGGGVAEGDVAEGDVAEGDVADGVTDSFGVGNAVPSAGMGVSVATGVSATEVGIGVIVPETTEVEAGVGVAPPALSALSEVGIGVAVMSAVDDGTGVAVGVFSPASPLFSLPLSSGVVSGINVGVGVKFTGIGSTISTDPSLAWPTMLRCCRLVKLGLGEVEMRMGAVRLVLFVNSQMMSKAMNAITPSGMSDDGGEKSAMMMSISPSVSVASKLVGMVKAAGRV